MAKEKTFEMIKLVGIERYMVPTTKARGFNLEVLVIIKGLLDIFEYYKRWIYKIKNYKKNEFWILLLFSNLDTRNSSFFLLFVKVSNSKFQFLFS